MFCRERVAQLRDVLPQIRAAGAELVCVGNGTASHARMFREDFDVDFPLLVDPDMQAYKAAGLRRGVLDALNPGAIAGAFRALRKGHLQGMVQGDPWQLGGDFVIGAGGDVRLAHVCRDPGDHVRAKHLLDALA